MEKKPISILLIDDDEDSFVLTRALLARAKRAAYQLDWVRTYEAGLEAIRAGRHAAYLVDYRLGASDGLTLIREAVKLDHTGPFVILTTTDDHDVDLQAIRAGAADYLVKGTVDAAELDRALIHALEFARLESAERELRRHRQELAMARGIQQRMLPGESPKLAGWDIAGRCVAANATGGDFYDYIALPNGDLNIVVADVSDHGFGAALVMSETRRLIRTLAKAECDLAEILTVMNRAIIEDTDFFVTLFTAQIDLKQRCFRYAAAGHDGYFIAASGETMHLNSTGMPLGVIEDAIFEISPSISFGLGDLLVLATDGLKESHSPDDGEFVTQRMLEVLCQTRSASVASVIDTLFSSIDRFSGGLARRDDVTAVAVKSVEN